MIQIKQQDPYNAAVVVHAIASEQGGEWLVNEGDDGGYVAVNMNSRHGQRMLRSGSPSIVGPISAAWDVDVIAADLESIKDAVSDILELPRQPMSLYAKVRELIGVRPMTAVDISLLLGVKRGAVTCALCKLAERGHAVRAGTVAGNGRGNHPVLFEAA